MMPGGNGKRRRKNPVLSSLFLGCCIFLLSGCSFFSSSASTSTSISPAAKITNISTQALAIPDPTLMKAQAILKKMSLNDKLAQMIMVEFLGSDYTASGLQQMIAQQHVGGFLYQDSDGNFKYPNNTVNATLAFSNQAIADAPLAPLIAIDQEGGLVSKTSTFFGATPSAEALAQSGDPQQSYSQAKDDASQLKQLGINVDLAPVVDVGPDTNDLVSRMFSSDPAVVSTYAGAFVKGLQDNGIPGTLKHFPGLGSVPYGFDPHSTLPQVVSSLSDLQSSDFLPYQKIIQQDNPAMIMTTDVVTQALDPTLPAELSPKVMSYLRNTLHFNGVIITDGLYMGGLYNGQEPDITQLTQTAVQAIEAGNDLIEGPSTPDEITSIITALTAAIQQGTLPQAQVDQSVTRILMMKVKYGIIK